MAPDWTIWLAPGPFGKSHAAWTIADAAALLVGVESTGEWPNSLVMQLGDHQRVVHDRFIDKACAAVGDKLKSWTRRYQTMQPTAANPISMAFPSGDLIDFAIAAGFEVPAPILANLASLPRTTKPSLDDTHLMLFAGLVAEIRLRAANSHVSIEIDGQLTFTRKDLAGLLYRLIPEFPGHQKFRDDPDNFRTLTSYITKANTQGARIKFREGPRGDAENPLPNLFPASK